MVVPSRFELLTPTVSVQCSNQLSYGTIKKHSSLLALSRREDSRFRINIIEKQKTTSSILKTTLLRLSFCFFSRKEVFQPHLPVRLPCYDLTPVTSFTLGSSLRLPTSGTPSSHGLTGGVYKARERIHRAMADARLLAIPASQSRVADSNPN